MLSRKLDFNYFCRRWYIIIPKHATLLLGRNCKYQVECIHFDTKQVTLKEKEKVFNTVSFNNVIFDYSGLSQNEVRRFERMIK